MKALPNAYVSSSFSEWQWAWLTLPGESQLHSQAAIQLHPIVLSHSRIEALAQLTAVRASKDT
jgi:hypothetical protein